MTRNTVSVTAAAVISLAMALMCCSAGVQALQANVFRGAGGAELRTTAEIEAAFQQDGFEVASWYSYQGFRGCIAHSVNVTILRTGLPKVAYYVEGTGYAMGYLMGLMAEPEVKTMCVDWVDRLIPSLVVDKFEEKHVNATWWDDVLDVIGEFFVNRSYKSFQAQVAEGDVFPQNLLDEVQGVADGCVASNPNTQVTYARLVTLNYGMDWLSINAFGGNLRASLVQVAKDMNKSQQVIHVFETTKDMIDVPVYCDAFGVNGEVTPSGATFFARDFQLPTGDVFQDIAGLAIFNPTDGRHALISVMAPGVVGSITILNDAGVAMAVDTVRSAFGYPDAPGLNSAFLIRHVGGNANDTESALEIITNAKRGCPWLYSLCDIKGNCVIVEAGGYLNDSQTLNPLSYVENESILKLLPNAEYLEAHSSASIFKNGAYIRSYDYDYPTDYLNFNQALFDYFYLSFNASSWGEDGFVWDSWQNEHVAVTDIQNRYFPPLRTLPTSRDYVVVSNLAIVPEMRITMMSPKSDLVARLSDAAQWRYDSLNDMLLKRSAEMDLATAIDTISFLSPDRTPGYWNNTIIPNDPMSAQVEGAISVAQMQPGFVQLHSKTGYYADGWIYLTLLNYL